MTCFLSFFQRIQRLLFPRIIRKSSTKTWKLIIRVMETNSSRKCGNKLYLKMNSIPWQYQKELLFYPMPLYRELNSKIKFHVDYSQVSLFFSVLQSLRTQLQNKKGQHNQHQYPVGADSHWNVLKSFWTVK